MVNILVVSCTQDTLKMRKELLEFAFPEAQIAPFVDPLLAAQYVGGHDVDLALCDFRLRIIDGIQLIKLLQRQNDKVIPALTESDGRHRADAQTLGIGYLPQPISPRELRSFYSGAVVLREDAI
ncbi:MAG: hypothetical protein VB021_00655 [Oscillospiraceae bacterium]|nr:hypothetical protein [Oscillospiraceae bacterium]